MYNKVCVYLKNKGETDLTKFLLMNKGKGGESYIGEWEYDIPKPTMEQLNAITDAEVKLTNYAELREYPPIGEQLDALWKGGQDAEDMKVKIEAVKKEFPKV